MAEFDISFQKVLSYEGGYVNDPDDPGGETYKGIARKMNSKWDGWVLVDLLKQKPGFPAKTVKGWPVNDCKIFYLLAKLRRMPPERDPEREDAELRADGFDPDEMRRSCKEMDEDMKKTMGANP